MKTRKTKKSEIPPLNLFLARAGVGSRRSVVELIKAGDVYVNNKIILEPGHKILPNDIVKYQDRIIKEEAKVYILLNKPKGYVTTVSDDRGRKTVMDLIKVPGNERLFPIGRLDRDTTGVLIITNDGDFSQELAHPRYKIIKKYHVVLDRPLDFEDMQRIRAGLFLNDGKASVDLIHYLKEKNKNHVMIELHIGKKHIVKRIFDHCGYKVIALDRVSFGGLTKKGLPIGRWKLLSKDEICLLMSK